MRSSSVYFFFLLVRPNSQNISCFCSSTALSLGSVCISWHNLKALTSFTTRFGESMFSFQRLSQLLRSENEDSSTDGSFLTFFQLNICLQLWSLVGPMGSACLSEISPYLLVNFWSMEMQMFVVGHHKASFVTKQWSKTGHQRLACTMLPFWTEPNQVTWVAWLLDNHPQAWLQGWVPDTLFLAGYT